MNKASNGQEVTLSITLDHDDGVVRARSWLKGKVVLVAIDETTPISLTAGELQLDLVGKEEVCFPPHGVIRSGLCRLIRSGNSKKEAVVFEEHMIVHDFSKRAFVSGDNNCTEYPFSIYLPGTLPPSMNFDDAEGGGGCCVRYRLTATLAVPQHPSTTESKDNRTMEHPLQIVGEALSTKKYPYVLQPTYYPMKQGLFNSGYDLILAARAENTHVAKGAAIDFSLAFRNKSRHLIERVEFHLIEEIQWNSSAASASTRSIGYNGDAGQYTTSRTVTLGFYKDLVLDCLRKESLETGDDPSMSSSSSLEPPKVDVLTLAEMHNCLLLQRNVVRMRLPASARDSYTGKLIKVSHYVEVVPVVKNKPSDRHINIPFKVFDPPIEAIRHSRRASSENTNATAATKWQEGANVLDYAAKGNQGIRQYLGLE